MSDEIKEGRTNIEDLPRAEEELSPEEAQEVKGGVGMLLPAIQKVREASAKPTSLQADDVNNDDNE